MTGQAALGCLGALACSLLLTAGAPGGPTAAQTPAPDPSSAMASAASAWLTALDPARQMQASLPFGSEERLNWGFVPRSRRGVSIREMSTGERSAARAILESSLSKSGLTKVDAIVQLEEVLFALQGSAIRNPELYYVTLFGTPAPQGAWGWRFEGHHVSLNWTIRDGRLVSSTPQFLGADPAEVRDGPRRGTRPLAAEEDLAHALVLSLSPKQRARAVVDDDAPPDILTGSSRAVVRLADEGVAYADLNPEQQGTLLALLEEYASVQSEAVARARLEQVRTGLPSVRFAWRGGLEKGQGHYYRIQGASFLIEYDNTQDDANHIHSVWREFQGDWGRDLLAEHYATAPHHAAARRAAAGRIS